MTCQRGGDASRRIRSADTRRAAWPRREPPLTGEGDEQAPSGPHRIRSPVGGGTPTVRQPGPRCGARRRWMPTTRPARPARGRRPGHTENWKENVIATQHPITGVRRLIRPDGTIERTEFRDQPPSVDETVAFAKYRDLSPLELLRRLRTAEWNLDVARADRETWRTAAQRLEQELAHAERKLAAITPDGWKLPRAVEELLACAQAQGWRSACAWTARGAEEMLLTIRIGRRTTPQDPPARGSCWEYQLAWSCVVGSARRNGRGIARTPDRPQWHDAPSLRTVRDVMNAHPHPA